MPKNETTSEKNMTERPPVVVIMGHIDHGKSTLLDYIRKSKIVAGEAGGITQHIAAYEVESEVEDGQTKKISFLDTPGHEAFVAVRERGANIADIAILIVSAEDGVKTQTKEALKSILEAGMPYVVAINKIDSPKANVDLTKSSLVENEVYLEGNGGDIPFVEVSALNGDGVDDLLNLILLVSDMNELTGNSDSPAEGVIIEAHKDKSKGITATLIIKNGTLEKGMFVASETAFSPIRAMENSNGEQVTTATFSSPITISGWSDIPPVGSDFKTFDSKKEVEKFCKACKEDRDKPSFKNALNAKAEEGEIIIPLIIKTDVSGTGEAIAHELKKIDVERVSFNIVEQSTGNISEKNMKTASASPDSIVVGFNVSIDPQADALRERDGIETNTFNIIYELTDWLKKVAKEKQPRIEVDEINGVVKILKIFNKTKNTQIIGGKVKSGSIAVGNKVRILRRNEEIGTGVIKGLQQQKSEATTVSEGNEFGGALDTKIELAESDHLEAIEKVIK